MSNKTARHSRESESYVLAALLDNNDRIEEAVSAGVTDASFYTPAHKHIWSAISAIHANGQAADDVTVYDYLSDHKNCDGDYLLDLCGGPAGVAKATDRSGSGVYFAFDTHLKKVLDLELERRLVATCSELAAVSQDKGVPIEERVSNAEGKILAISEQSAGVTVQIARDHTEPVLDRIIKINAGECDYGLSTGYHDLDRVMGKMRKANMIFLAARPGCGKTSLSLNIADNVCSAGGKVLMFSLEMLRDQVLQRMIFARAAVRSDLMADGMLNEMHMGKLRQAKDAIDKMDFFILDDPSVDILRIKSYSRAMHKRRGLDLIIIDYLQIIKSYGHRGNREREVAEISNGILNLAKETGVPILVIGQLNRESEKDKRWPRKSDIRESGACEADSHVIVFLSRVDQKGEPLPFRPGVGQELDLIVAKNRDWREGDTKMNFNGAHTRFYTYDRSLADDPGVGFQQPIREQPKREEPQEIPF